MQDSIEEIKKRIDIVEYIGSFIALKKAGRNFKAVCPFHQEKTPSFVISPDRQIWHCFGACAEGGDIIKFLMKFENLTFIEAVKELAEKAGVKLADIRLDDKVGQKKERLLKLNNLTSEFFSYVLKETEIGKKAKEYLRERGVNTKLADKFNLGYAPSSWDSLMKFLTKKKFEVQEMMEAGVLVRGERGGFYDRFRGRIVFPIKDVRGNVIGFSGRSLEGEDGAKYINTPESPIYHKRESLYGIYEAKEAIKKEKQILLVEGEFDVISSFAHGIENVAAVKGTAVTREQLMLIKRYTPRVTLMLDADVAGGEAVTRTITEGQNLDMELEVIELTFAKDPDEAVRTDFAQFKKALGKPVPIYDFLLETYQKKYPDTDPFSKKRVGDEVIPYIARIDNPIVQSHYVKKIASFLDVSEGSIEAMIRRIKTKQKQQFSVSKKKEQEDSRHSIIQKYLLSLILQNKNPYKIADIIFDIVSPNDFLIPSLKKISDSLLEFKKQSKEFELSNFLNFLDPSLRPAFDEIYLYASIDLGFEEDSMKRLALEVKKLSLKKRMSDILSEGKKQTQKEEENLKDMSRQLKEVEKTLATV